MSLVLTCYIKPDECKKRDGQRIDGRTDRRVNE